MPVVVGSPAGRPGSCSEMLLEHLGRLPISPLLSQRIWDADGIRSSTRSPSCGSWARDFFGVALCSFMPVIAPIELALIPATDRSSHLTNETPEVLPWGKGSDA